MKTGLIVLAILVCFGIVGEMDYQDAVAQEAPKTMIASKVSK